MEFDWRGMPTWINTLAKADLLPRWVCAVLVLLARPRRVGQSVREKRLRKYFAIPPSVTIPRLIFWLALGLTFLCLAVLRSKGGCLPLIAQLIAGLAGFVALVSGLVWFLRYSKALELQASDPICPMPSDAEVQDWLEERLGALSAISRDALGLVGEAVAGPLIVVTPNLDSVHTSGIDLEDFGSRKGEDGVWRFGVYNALVIWPTELELAGYACDYNFIRDVALNVETKEFHYSDVVAVSTGEESSSRTLPTAVKMTHSEEFRISVASGEAIRVVVGSDELRAVSGEDELPDTGVRKAVAAIRAMLREKKH